MPNTAFAPESQGGLKDTFESILIALILAFVFRCFVVEAFVIPTGSMATTLLGAHMRFKCEDCGYDFTANYSAPQVPGSDDVRIPTEAQLEYNENIGGRIVRKVQPQTFHLACPNCGFKVPRDLPNKENDANSPPVHYGDRILVMKYAYLLSDPKRWDVVVFKSPYDQRENDRVPRPLNKPDFQQNYIKRLVGLPGEQLMILDGDIYTRSDSNSPWTIQPKTPAAQQAVWRIIADNDYQPRNLAGSYRSPWLPSDPSAVTPHDSGRSFVLSATDTPARLAFDPSANPAKHPLTDWLAFNITHYQQRSGTPDAFPLEHREPNPDANVSDLKLHLTYQRLSGDGPFRVALGKRGDQFIAEFTPSGVSLLRQPSLPPSTQPVTLATATLPPGEKLDIIFQNVDYRVSLIVNGKQLLATTPQQYSPDVDALISEFNSRTRPPIPTIQLSSTHMTARVTHLSLWRDLYYINSPTAIGSGPLEYGSPDSPITLGPKEFFVCGDNSQLSLDARFWEQPIDLLANENLYSPPGRVPERFMLGKAFFVYWPAGHRPAPSLPGIIPNFGNMRLIH